MDKPVLLTKEMALRLQRVQFDSAKVDDALFNIENGLTRTVVSADDDEAHALIRELSNWPEGYGIHILANRASAIVAKRKANEG